MTGHGANPTPAIDEGGRFDGAVWPFLREQGYGRTVVATSTSGICGTLGRADDGALPGMPTRPTHAR